MSPYPRTSITHANHMSGLHFPVLVTIWPEVADTNAEPREKGNILRTGFSWWVARVVEDTYLTPAPVAEEPSTWKYTGR